MYLYPWTRTRYYGALLLTLVFGLLPTLPRAEQRIADDRIDLDTEALPWPFQLTEIQRFDRDTYFLLEYSGP